MKRLALMLSIAALALAQKPRHHSDVSFSAERLNVNGVVTHLAGNVTIDTDAMQLRADSADYKGDTKEIVAQGAVRIRLK
jgi:lipopolysaccharide assembly outer membrane protein LptD (OstA)